MQRLYSANGASDISILGERYSKAEWENMRLVLRQLLEKRDKKAAIKLLDRFPWTVVDATNGFRDEFGVLYAQVPLPLYAENGHLTANGDARQAAAVLAETLTEIQPEWTYIRHVAYALEAKTPAERIPFSEPRFTSATVQRALADADRLLTAGSAVSAVDRVHTALLGYLRLVCRESGFTYDEKDSSSALLKRIAANHAAFSTRNHRDELVKVLRGAGAILDAFDPLRNRGSVAHANEHLLEEPEAEFVINVARSLFMYLRGRIEGV